MTKLLPAFNTGLRELYPLFCGYEDCTCGHSFGPAVRDYYLIHYIRSGEGVFVVKGCTYPVTAGKCFIIRPNETTLYQADDKNPWQYIWIAFTGERVASFLQAAKFDECPVFGSERIADVFHGFYRQINDGMLDGLGNEFSMLSVLYAIFAALPQDEPVESQRDLYIRKVCNYVNKMISNPVSVERLAGYCGLERHYLCRIFKAQTGLTLQEYVLDCKMRKARELLTATPLSVGDIARSVGYTDCYNFSKMFKKHYALSPMKLREREAYRR